MGIIQTHFEGDRYLNLEERERTFVTPAFHSHPAYELYVLKEGQRKLYVGNRLYNTGPGDVALIPAKVPHRSFGQTAYSGICIEFSLVIDGNGEFREYLLDMIKLLSFYKGIMDCNTKIAVDSDLSPIGTYIQKHYLTIKGLDDLVSHYNMTKSYLCRVFKKQTGICITAYINSLKIQHACQYLNETDFPISVIAKKCGFSSVIYFNRVFKKVMEHTPKEIRKMEKKSTK